MPLGQQATKFWRCNDKEQKMRFLADMGVSPRCVMWLRAQGYDAIHLYEQGLHKLPDNEVLLKAKLEKGVLLTMDLDFPRLLSNADADDCPTVIVFRMSDQRPRNVQIKLDAILPIIKESIELGSVIFSVGDDRVRMRCLPIV